MVFLWNTYGINTFSLSYLMRHFQNACLLYLFLVLCVFCEKIFCSTSLSWCLLYMLDSYSIVHRFRMQNLMRVLVSFSLIHYFVYYNITCENFISAS